MGLVRVAIGTYTIILLLFLICFGNLRVLGMLVMQAAMCLGSVLQ